MNFPQRFFLKFNPVNYDPDFEKGRAFQVFKAPKGKQYLLHNIKYFYPNLTSIQRVEFGTFFEYHNFIRERTFDTQEFREHGYFCCTIFGNNRIVDYYISNLRFRTKFIIPAMDVQQADIYYSQYMEMIYDVELVDEHLTDFDIMYMLADLIR